MKVKIGKFVFNVSIPSFSIRRDKFSEEVESVKSDLSKISGFFSSFDIKYSSVFFVFLVFLIAFMSFFIRSQTMDVLGSNLIGLDPDLFYRYTNYIVENGRLMENDTMRYYPTGLDTSRETLLLPYMLASFYKVFHVFLPGLTVLKVVQIYPAVASFFFIIVFYFLCKELLNNRVVAVLSALLLAVVPSFLFRTIAGFSDKEPLGILFMFISAHYYVKFIKNKSLAPAVFSGFFNGLMALSWGGFTIWFFVVAFHFIILALTGSVDKKFFAGFCCWLAVTSSIILLFSNRYNLFYLIPWDISVIGVLSVFLDSLFFKKIKQRLIPSSVLSFFVASVLCVFTALIIDAGSVIGLLQHILLDITNPLGGGAMPESVSENQPAWFVPDWTKSFGNLFYFIFLGAVLIFFDFIRVLFEDYGPIIRSMFTLPFVLFLIVLIFSKYQPNHIITLLLSPFYLISFPLMFVYASMLGFMAWRNHGLTVFNKVNRQILLLFIWFIFTVIGARGAVRLIFVFTPPAILVSVYLILRVSNILTEYFGKSSISRLGVFATYACVIFISGLFFSSSFASANSFGPSTIGDWDDGFNWVKSNTPVNSTFIHWWDYGYWIQSISNRTTVSDGGNYNTTINYNIGRHLFGAYNLSEVRDLLSWYSDPDYFYVVSDDVGKFYQMARIGERNVWYTHLYTKGTDFNMYDEINRTEFPEVILIQPGGGVPIWDEFIVDGVIYPAERTYLVGVVVPFNRKNNTSGESMALIYNDVSGTKLFKIKGQCEVNKGCFVKNSVGVPGYVLIFTRGGIWIPWRAGDMLMTRLYLDNQSIPGFDLAYESSSTLYDMQNIVGGGLRQNIRVYKLNYTEMDSAVSSNYSWLVEG